jgi:hypothetical protein
MKTKQKIEGQCRQGDVLIERVEKLPVKAKKAKRVILAHGEVTGHAHEIANPKLASIAEVKEAWRLLGDLPDADSMTRHALDVKGNTAVKHQEHGQIPMNRSGYRVTRQREYHPAEIRNVAD